MRVGGELGWSSLPALSHGQENPVNPCVDGHGIKPFVGEKQNAIRYLHANAWESLESLAKFRRREFGDGLEIEFPISEHSGGIQKIPCPIAQATPSQGGLRGFRQNLKGGVGMYFGTVHSRAKALANGE